MDRKTKGRLAEAKVLCHLVEDGYEVYLPYSEGAKYDLLAVKGSMVQKVSVKFTSEKKNANWRVTMTQVSRRNAGLSQVDKFQSDEYDLIAVYIGPEDRVVVVPATQATPNILTVKAMEV